jgi:hypothetical protein
MVFYPVKCDDFLNITGLFTPSMAHYWDSSVGMAYGERHNDRKIGVRFPAWAENFSQHRVQSCYVNHPDSYPMVTGVLSVGVNPKRREADMKISNTMQRSGDH